MDENNMGNNNSIENNNDANGFVMVDNPAPPASQAPQEPQTENQNQNQPVQPEPEAASQYIQPEPEATSQYTQPEPEPAQQQNTNYEQPVQPSPMPSEDNTYRFQNVEAQNVKKKKEKKIQGAALKPARGKRPWTGLQNFVLFCRRRRKTKNTI